MNTLQSFIQANPYLTDKTILDLQKIDRLCPVLVRCGQCRFTAGAQDVPHIIKALETAGDYVRDVSFPVGAFENASKWCDHNAMSQTLARAAANKAAGLVGKVPDKRKLSDTIGFNEADCGGVFDGFSVSSDADPGL